MNVTGFIFILNKRNPLKFYKRGIRLMRLKFLHFNLYYIFFNFYFTSMVTSLAASLLVHTYCFR